MIFFTLQSEGNYVELLNVYAVQAFPSAGWWSRGKSAHGTKRTQASRLG